MSKFNIMDPVISIHSNQYKKGAFMAPFFVSLSLRVRVLLDLMLHTDGDDFTLAIIFPNLNRSYHIAVFIKIH